MTAPPTCAVSICTAPALPGHPRGFCAECAAMAVEIATQRIRAATLAVHALKGEQAHEEKAA